MKTEKKRDFLELAGVAAIVVSLGFVTYEIRQNTNAVRSTVIHSISQQSIDSIAFILENPELRRAQAAVTAGNPTPDEQRLVDLQYTALLRIQLNRFLQSEIGVIDREMVLRTGGRRGGSVYGTETFGLFWEMNKEDYTEDFQVYMEQFVLPR